VSDYPFAADPSSWLVKDGLAISNLSSAARSASDVAAWLLTEYNNTDAPLASLHVLLSPVDGERINTVVRSKLDPRTSRAESRAVIEEIQNFQNECRSDPDNLVFVYITGHGVQTTTRSAVVLLSDIGDPRLPNRLSAGLDVAGFHAAMNSPGNPSKQVWFSDACRQDPDVLKAFEALNGAICPDIPAGHVETSALVLAASTGESAYARPRGTLFSDALLAGLRGAAVTGPRPGGIPDWHVRLFDLITWIDARVKKVAKANAADQSIDPTGRVLDLVLQRFTTPPDVRVTLRLSPKDNEPLPDVVIDRETRVVANFVSWPAKGVIPAGRYRITVNSTPPRVRDVEITPLRFQLSILPEA
jgi:hypothetical protein